MKKQISVVLTAMFVLASMAAFSQNMSLKEKSAVEKENIKFYNNIWEVAINQGRASILDSVYADDAVLFFEKIKKILKKIDSVREVHLYINAFIEEIYTKNSLNLFKKSRLLSAPAFCSICFKRI